MATRNSKKSRSKTVCGPISHSFVHVDVTPLWHGTALAGQLGGLSAIQHPQPRTFILYCQNCGEARKLV